ncbi:MAG: YqjF family protein [Flavisolibacter sp.]
MPKPFLTAAWRNLLMANYAIDPELLKPYLPCHTELDSFNGMHMVSLVGFMFMDTRVKGISIPFHRNFEEVNLRFYVRYKDQDGWKRGVVFMKEIVPKRAISFIANNLYGEKYVTHEMNHVWEAKDGQLNIAYNWKVNGQWDYIKAVAEISPSEMKEGSEVEFITEHYWGYTRVDHRCSGVYEVRHPKWKVHQVLDYEIRCSASYLYGKEFEEPLNHPPVSVFLAEGSDISVFPGKKLFS